MNTMNYDQNMSGIAMLQEGGVVSDGGMDFLSDAMLSAEIEEIGKLDGSEEEQASMALLEQEIMSLLERQVQGETNFSPEEMQLLEAVNAEAGDMDIDDADDEDIPDPSEEPLSASDIEELKEAAVGLASLGRMGDDSIAHVATGEVVLPVEMMEDPDFTEAMVTRFEAMGIDPMSRVVGSGIASLNDISGLEEFGFLKKVGKSIKKRVKKVAKSVKKVAKNVVKPVAKVAQFIPGPWQPAAALISKVSTVYDVAKGRASPLNLLSVAGPTAAGGSLGANVKALQAASGTGGISGLAKGLGEGLKAGVSGAKSGITSILTNPQDALGNIGKVLNSATYSGQPSPLSATAQTAATGGSGGLQIPTFGGGTINVGGPFGGSGLTTTQAGTLSSGVQNITGLTSGAAGGKTGFLGGLGSILGGVFGFGQPPATTAPQSYTIQSGDTLSAIAAQYGVSVQDIMNANPSITDPNVIYAGNTITIPTMGTGQQGTQQTGQQGTQQTGQQGTQQTGQPQIVTNPQTGQPQIIIQQTPPQQSGGMSGLARGLAAGIPALLLAKFAYDEAKKDRGVTQNPMTSMSGMGRFNIEEEIARRTGAPAPNPIEYGLLPSGSLPAIAAAAPLPRGRASDDVLVGTQAYADGGMVEEDFIPMDGEIAGEGTEQSDSIPAMLSDGEFVMNGQAVRGAGGYQMMNDGGIITLIPSESEDRNRGTQMMYDLMNEFQSSAMPARA